jgi:hypothetical protein
MIGELNWRELPVRGKSGAIPPLSRNCEQKLWLFEAENPFVTTLSFLRGTDAVKI